MNDCTMSAVCKFNQERSFEIENAFDLNCYLTQKSSEQDLNPANTFNFSYSSARKKGTLYSEYVEMFWHPLAPSNTTNWSTERKTLPTTRRVAARYIHHGYEHKLRDASFSAVDRREYWFYLVQLEIQRCNYWSPKQSTVYLVSVVANLWVVYLASSATFFLHSTPKCGPISDFSSPEDILKPAVPIFLRPEFRYHFDSEKQSFLPFERFWCFISRFSDVLRMHSTDSRVSSVIKPDFHDIATHSV